MKEENSKKCNLEQFFLKAISIFQICQEYDIEAKYTAYNALQDALNNHSDDNSKAKYLMAGLTETFWFCNKKILYFDEKVSRAEFHI